MQKKRERKNTDFFLRNEIDPVVILQPVATAGMHSYAELEDVPESSGWDHHFRRVADEIVDPHRFVHVGNLILAGSQRGESWEVRSYSACGETVELVDPEDRYSGVRFTCLRCNTKIRFRGNTTREGLSNLLLHLLLKQMVPDLPTCNYIHLEDGIGGELGTIAVAEEELGINPKDGVSTMSSLGFTLIPGMNTLNSFGGFDGWLKVLLVIKHRQLEVVAKSQLPQLLGPKQNLLIRDPEPFRFYWGHI